MTIAQIAQSPGRDITKGLGSFALRAHAWKTPWLVSSPRWVIVTRPGEAIVLRGFYGNTVQPNRTAQKCE
jgi:hypothetical protein